MLIDDNLAKLKIKHISEILPGMFVANLGEILEIDELESHYAFVIARMNEKQVLKFEKEQLLYIVQD